MDEHTHYEVTTSDGSVLVPDIIKEIMDVQIDNMMVFKNAVDIKPVKTFEWVLELPKHKYLFPQGTSEGARGKFQAQEWFKVYGSLHEEEANIFITDRSKGVMLTDLQFRSTVEAEAAGFAWKKDNEIKDVLLAGAASTITASGPWDDGATDIARDLAAAIGVIFSESTIAEGEIGNIQIFYPAKLWAYLAKPIEIGQIQQSIRQWAQQNFQINFWPTRSLTNNVIINLKSPRTARHLIYNGPGLVSVEYERLPGRGDVYIYKQAYDTFIMPEEEGETTNPRIRLISGVL